MTDVAFDRKIKDSLSMACFLFNMEADKGYDHIYGGIKLGEVINAFCRFTGVERPMWEEIVWPREKNIKPRKEVE